MKKIITLLFFIGFSLLFTTGCKKPKGTFSLDNYVEYSMSVDWCGYSMSVPAFGYNSYTVNAGGGTAEVYANGYGYWGSIYIDVPADGINGIEMYWNDNSTKSALKKSTGRNPNPKPTKP